MVRRRPAAIWCTVLVLLTLAVPTSGAQRLPPPPSYLVTRVVDGDTMVLERIGKVRLIGVDTPEIVGPRRPAERFGKQASDFTRRLVGGKRVRVEYDWKRKDRYNRTLAYVYLEDDTLVNAEIIRQGYGVAYTHYPFKFLNEFRNIEREARGKERGLWAPNR